MSETVKPLDHKVHSANSLQLVVWPHKWWPVESQLIQHSHFPNHHASSNVTNWKEISIGLISCASKYFHG